MRRFIKKNSLALHPSSTNSTPDSDPSIFILVHALLLQLGTCPVELKKKKSVSLKKKVHHTGGLKINERQERKT